MPLFLLVLFGIIEFGVMFGQKLEGISGSYEIVDAEAHVAACIAAKLHTQMLIVPHTNHFTVLECAVSATEPLCTALFDLWR